MTLKSDIPRYIEVAHWLYEQQCLISARDASEVLGGSVWTMGQVFSKIRSHSNIFVIDEKRIRSKGGMQTLMRVVHILPYTLDQYNQPHRQYEDTCNYVPLTWRDLLCKDWSKLGVKNI